MDDWQERPLGDLFEVQLGKMLGTDSGHGTQYPYLANRNVQWGRVVIDDELGTMHFSRSERYRYRLQSGDLLICEGGEVGRAALWSDELPECYFQNAIHRLRPRVAVDARFMRHYFEFAASHGLLRALTGRTSIGHLPRANLVRWTVAVPPLQEQRRIAEILDTIDEAIQATERVISKLLATANGMVSETIERVLKAGASCRLGDVQDNHPGSLIQTGPFGSQLHASDYVTDGTPTFMPANICDGELDATEASKISAKKAEQLRRHRIQTGDVLLARRGDLSRCAVVPPALSGAICGTGCLLVRIPKQALDPEWLAAAYRHSFVQRQVLGRAVGSTMPNISAGVIRSLVIPMPTTESNYQMTVARSVLRRIDTEQASIRKLHRLKAGLAADLLSGRVRTVAA